MQVEQPNGSTKSFTFNVTFEPDATQEDVFENSGVKKLVEMAVEGSVICCIHNRHHHHHHHHPHFGTPSISLKRLKLQISNLVSS